MEETVYDMKRAAIFSRLLDHIRSVWDNWYFESLGMREKTEIIPCPFCYEDRAHFRQKLTRSFSEKPELDDNVKLVVMATGGELCNLLMNVYNYQSLF